MNYLFVYVDGYDLDDVEKPLLKAFEAFVGTWPVPVARVINDKLEPEADDEPDWLPEWNLGLNFEFDKLPKRGFEELIGFLAELAQETGREFVIGYWDPRTQISEDWWHIGEDPDPRDLEFLVQMYGRF